ncbi:MAG: signal peptide peptidase SppA [candidate division WOR-3 bacterium]
MSRRTLVIFVVVGVVATLFTTALTVLFFIAGVREDFPSPGDKALGYVTIEGTLTDSRETVRQLRSLGKNPKVKGVLIRVESPGGGVTAAHEIYTEIKRLRDAGKPVVVSMGTVAASGGYYISTPATVIAANPGTLTGSIGVIMQLPIVNRLLDKLGLKVETIKSREAKDIGSPFREMTEKDRQLLQDVVSDVYEQFLNIVSTERKIPLDSLKKIADGRILTGRQAKQFGLVDTLLTLEEAKRLLADMCGIKGEPRLLKPRPRLPYYLRNLFEKGAEEFLGLSRFPRLMFRWF